MPSRSGIFAFQPNELIFEMSSNLRGVPSGRLRSQAQLAVKADDFTDQLGQLADRQVGPSADVDDLGAS